MAADWFSEETRQKISKAAGVVARWVAEHEKELRSAGTWATVTWACRQTGLYAPPDEAAWREIDEACRAGVQEPVALEALILGIYGSHGSGYHSLRATVIGAPLLDKRTREVTEVFDSLVDGRNYVTICGALPLVEHALAMAAGKWQKLNTYDLASRLEQEDPGFTEEEIDLMLDMAAIEMIQRAPDEIWTGGSKVGASVPGLLRNVVLHGTGIGWDNDENAVRSVLLLAAAVRVAKPLLRQR